MRCFGLALLGFAVAPLFSAGPAAAEVTRTRLAGPTFDHREKLAGRAEVEIRMDRGKLVVRGGANQGETRAGGRLGRDVAALELQREGHWLRFEVQPKAAPPGTPLELDSELELQLPAGSDLTIEGPAVAVRIEGVLGKIDVRTLSGEVVLAGQSAAVEVQTISGPIRTADFTCPLTVLRSVAGAIELGGAFEELTARTAESTLRVTGSISDEARLESGQGLVSFEGELGPVARLVIATLGGEARLLLPADLEGRFAIRSFEGELESALGPAFDHPGLRRRSEWQRGAAARRVEVETFDGKITLLAR